MKKILLPLLVLVLCSGTLRAQYYEASYECVYKSGLFADGTVAPAGEGTPVSATFIYEVKADARYIHVKGWLKESNTLSYGPVKIRNEVSQTELVIDLDKKLVYLQGEDEYQLADEYSFTSSCDSTGLVKQLAGKDSSILITLATDLPWFVSPGIVFNTRQNCGGIRKVFTKMYVLELSGAPKQVAGRLDYSPLFKNYDRNKSYERYRFFD